MPLTCSTCGTSPKKLPLRKLSQVASLELEFLIELRLMQARQQDLLGREKSTNHCNLKLLRQHMQHQPASLHRSLVVMPWQQLVAAAVMQQ